MDWAEYKKEKKAEDTAIGKTVPNFWKQWKSLKGKEKTDFLDNLKGNVRSLVIAYNARMEKQQARKDAFLQELSKNGGNISGAAKAAGVYADKIYRYMKDDDEFKARVEAIREFHLDIAEQALIEKIQQEKDPQLIKFILSTRGTQRGYGGRCGVSFEEIQERTVGNSDEDVSGMVRKIRRAVVADVEVLNK